MSYYYFNQGTFGLFNPWQQPYNSKTCLLTQIWMELVIVQSYRLTLDSCMLSFCPRCLLSVCSDARVSSCRPREQGLWSPLADPCHQRYCTVNLYTIQSPDQTFLISLWCGGAIPLNDFMVLEWFVWWAYHTPMKSERVTPKLFYWFTSLTVCLPAAVLSWCFTHPTCICCIVVPGGFP